MGGTAAKRGGPPLQQRKQQRRKKLQQLKLEHEEANAIYPLVFKFFMFPDSCTSLATSVSKANLTLLIDYYLTWPIA